MASTLTPPSPPDVRPIIGREHLLIALLKLAQPERELLRLHMSGEAPDCIARRVGLEVRAVRARLRSVLARTRELAANLANATPTAA